MSVENFFDRFERPLTEQELDAVRRTIAGEVFHAIAGEVFHDDSPSQQDRGAVGGSDLLWTVVAVLAVIALAMWIFGR